VSTFGDRVGDAERQAAQLAVDRQTQADQRKVEDAAAANAFAEFLAEVSQTLQARGIRSKRVSARITKYGVVKTKSKLGRFDGHTRTFRGWVLPVAGIWMEVGGGHWAELRRRGNDYEADFSKLRQARDPSPVYVISNHDGTFRPGPLSVLPVGVTWSRADGFLRSQSARDGPTWFISYEDQIASAVAGMG
jgi:hypothetical protein